MTKRQFRLSERIAAGYLMHVVSPVADVGWDVALFLFWRLSPRFARWLAEFLQMRLLPFLMLDFLAWPLALPYMRALPKEKQEGGRHD